MVHATPQGVKVKYGGGEFMRQRTAESGARTRPKPMRKVPANLAKVAKREGF